jgi:F-type H+-transporting ATPase subunit a
MLPGVDHGNVHVATAAIVTLGLIALSVGARAALGQGEAAVMPSKRLSLKGLFELLTEFIVSLTEMVIGKGNEKYVPLFASVFTFILINNLVGLIPGMTPATENFNTTFAIGVFSFLVYNFVGIREKGFKYYQDFTGHLPLSFIWLWPLMLVIEIISHVFRPVSLGLRLAGNMTGDHAVVSLFLELLPAPYVYVVPVVFYALGLLVCFIQAFVFTLLSMTYVMMAQPHDDH